MAFGAAAVAVALFVILYVPPAPVEGPSTTITTEPAACSYDDDLCRAVRLLEDLRDERHRMTPAERQAVDALAEEVAEVIVSPPSATTPAPPPTTSMTTTTTTTSTTVPPPPGTVIPADGVADAILGDLLGTGEVVGE